MPQHITILYTVIDKTTDLQIIYDAIATFNCVTEWSLDLDDCDNVLRILSSTKIGIELVQRLKEHNVKASVMEVFEVHSPAAISVN